ncbi:uncharacterized protein LOC110268891 [Arachis ipaensis]|uniref:uncharacterized protein LOC110268891 n=1 Tax=Arachis ipaensis TaxID=130454 RepID=UPI000A2B89AF|nr:uncharacterized protein LOC110268891 [Arachis ipaensis]
MENLLVSRKITPIYLNSKIVSRAGMAMFQMIAASFSFPEQWLNRQQEFKQQEQLVVDKIVAFEGRNFLSDEFECLPGYMKGIATWEEEIKEMEREQIREGIDEFGILYSELSDSNRSKGSNGSFAFPVRDSLSSPSLRF